MPHRSLGGQGPLRPRRSLRVAAGWGVLTALASAGAGEGVGQERAPPSADSLPPTFTLTGRVVDGLTEGPVIAAVIKFPQLSRYAFSNVNGDFSFTDFPQGTWDVAVEQLGYHPTDASVTVSQGNGLHIRLAPDPVALEGFRVRTRAERLLVRRRHRVPFRVVTLDAEEFARAVNPDPLAVLRRNARAPIVACGHEQCVLRRGKIAPIAIYLDEGPLLGGMQELQLLNHQEIHSMDWILRPTSGELRVYTRWFIERLNNSRMSLAPFVW